MRRGLLLIASVFGNLFITSFTATTAPFWPGHWTTSSSHPTDPKKLPHSFGIKFKNLDQPKCPVVAPTDQKKRK